MGKIDFFQLLLLAILAIGGAGIGIVIDIIVHEGNLSKNNPLVKINIYS